MATATKFGLIAVGIGSFLIVPSMLGILFFPDEEGLGPLFFVGVLMLISGLAGLSTMLIGAVLAVIGGFGMRKRSLWQPYILVGIFSWICTFGVTIDILVHGFRRSDFASFSFLFYLPGFACLVTGIGIRILPEKTLKGLSGN